MYEQRIEKTLRQLETMGVSQMVVSDPHAIWYLTGVMVEPMERIYALYLNKTGAHKLILNKLFHIPPTDLNQVWLSDTDDAIAAIGEIVVADQLLGVDKNWPARYLLPLMERVDGLCCKVTSLAVDEVRAVKEEGELERMRQASIINDVVIVRAMNAVKDGSTEREIAEYIKDQYVQEGCENLSFPPIVAFGANASDPHHVSGDTVVQPGDCILIDTGCVYRGYCSDMTRTYFYQSASQRHLDIHEIVRQANLRAIELVRPGVRFCDIDGAARDYITAQGYGENFTHRLGHSIGSQCHEFGDVGALNADCVQVGNVFSIEPGIYLPGDVGVRIEDLIIVTETGCENLNAVDKTAVICG